MQEFTGRCPAGGQQARGDWQQATGCRASGGGPASRQVIQTSPPFLPATPAPAPSTCLHLVCRLPDPGRHPASHLLGADASAVRLIRQHAAALSLDVCRQAGRQAGRGAGREADEGHTSARHHTGKSIWQVPAQQYWHLPMAQEC